VYLLGRFRYVPKEEGNQQSTHMEASKSGRQHEDEPDIVGAMYNDTSGFLEKGEDSLKWGDIYQMFKKNNFIIDVRGPRQTRDFQEHQEIHKHT
jgi:hypothetical protein